MTDPVGDLLTRIRNGQSARLDSVTVPASRLRSNVLDVLQREGYIRGWFEEELRPGVKELRVELKYDNGQPVIKEIKRVSTPGRRVYSKIARAAAPLQRPRHLDPVHAARRHVRRRGARRQCRRRSPLQGVLSHVARRQESGRRSPRASPSTSRARHLKAKGKRGELAAHGPRRRRGRPRRRQAHLQAAQRQPPRAHAVGHGAQPREQHGARRVATASPSTSRSTASAIAPRPMPRT